MEHNSRIELVTLSSYADEHIVTGEESERYGYDWMSWGKDNNFPEYLHDLKEEVATLGSIINGCADYICGDAIVLSPAMLALFPGGVVNGKGETFEEVFRQIAESEVTYSGHAIEYIRRKDGRGIAEMRAIDLRFLRTDKEHTTYWYSEEWKNKWARKSAFVVLPRFMRDGSMERGVMYSRNDRTCAYPVPRWKAAIKDCEIERMISEYHLNSINNGFAGSVLINFNNGRPSKEEMDAIEEKCNGKFAGAKNGGKIVYSYNDDADHATTIEDVQISDFSDRYQALEKHSRQQIFTSFRANPVLFGMPSESMGFNNSADEYMSAFKLFNRTFIQPMQRRLVGEFEKMFGKGCITIKPFSIEGESEDNVGGQRYE